MIDRSESITPSSLWQRYRSVRPLGQSQFCRTDLAIDASENLCVVKQFLLPKPPDFSGLEAIEHPQLPRLIDRFDQVLVYEFIEGDSLAQTNLRDGNFRQLLIDLLPALQAIHAQGKLHGDIKPENIILSGDRPFLVDLNNAAVISNAGYAAPEATRGEPEAASDLFSLGLTCVHLLTGLPPFDLREVDWRSHLFAPIDPQFAEVLDRLLQPSLRRRYRSAEAVLRDLRAIPVRSIPAERSIRRSTWNCRQVLSGHSGDITTLAVSPDGYFFASGSRDRSIKLWDIASGTLVQTFAGRSLWSASGHRGRINALTFSPEGNLLISGSDDGTIKLWDLANRKLTRTIDAHDWGVDAIVVSQNGIATDADLLASGGGEGDVTLWDFEAGKRILSAGKHSKRVNAIAFSPNGRLLVSGSDDRTIRIWNLDRQQLERSIEAHSGSITALVFLSDRTFISASADKTLRFWQVERGELLTSVAAHQATITALAIAPDSPLLASASADHTVKLWDLSARRRIATLEHDWSVSAIVFTPNGLLISGSDETIRIWKSDEKRLLKQDADA